jgi:tRNA pseudouridine38-40 synthase
VVHADVPDGLRPARVCRALNAALGPVVVVRLAEWAPDGFDARFSAVRRSYRYRVDDSGDPDPLTRGFVLAWRRRLDLARMRQAAACLVGEHDFAAFCRARPGATTIRRLRTLGVRRVGGLVEVRVVADAFCWQMVRSIVGYLLAVGDGRRDPAGAAAVLAGRDRAAAGQVAPPHGLTLESVGYPRALALPTRPACPPGRPDRHVPCSVAVGREDR